MKQLIFDHIKNIGGWTTNRKLVVFSVDDYGSVRLHSNQALSLLTAAGISPQKRFDKLDCLENRRDLEGLYSTLRSAKDRNNKSAVFTPYALPCNINFDATLDSYSKSYVSETTVETFHNLAATEEEYKGAWECWQQGIQEGLMAPEFHGREHFNLDIFNELLDSQDTHLLLALKNRSYITLPSHSKFPFGWTAAYANRGAEEIARFSDIILDGIKKFEEVYQKKPSVFTPPAQQFPVALDQEVLNWPITAMDRPFVSKRELEGRSKKYFFKQKKLDNGLVHMVRNVVFEPNMNPSFNAVDFAMKQIEVAFRLNKPANISSHRVNFSGHISQENRTLGLNALKQLLKKITARWPEVEFISAGDLAKMIVSENE
jgi:hypothetical protein